MDSAGFTQRSLAEAVGITQQSIHHLIHRGEKSAYTAKIAEVLGVNALWLDTGKGASTRTDSSGAKSTFAILDRLVRQTPEPAAFGNLCITVSREEWIALKALVKRAKLGLPRNSDDS